MSADANGVKKKSTTSQTSEPNNQEKLRQQYAKESMPTIKAELKKHNLSDIGTNKDELINRLVTHLSNMSTSTAEIETDVKTQIRTRKKKGSPTPSTQPTKKLKTTKDGEKPAQDADDQSTDEPSGDKEKPEPSTELPDSKIVKDDQLLKCIQLQLQKSNTILVTSVQKKEAKRFACFNCRKAHTACSNSRPCKRCLTKGLDCYEEEGTPPTKLKITNENLATLKILSCSVPVEHKSAEKIKSLKGIEKCRHLEELNLSNNRVKKLDPVSSLLQLRILSVSTNRIQDIAALEKLTNLTSLDLSYNLIQEIKPLSQISKLVYLNLNNNAYVKDISPLASLPNLVSLSLSSNKIEDISVFANNFKSAQTLKTLHLYDNDIDDLKPLSALVNIKELNLGFNLFTDISTLIQLSRLCDVVLENNALFQSISQEQIKNNRHFVEILQQKGVQVFL